jgi:FAD/FMN-containing dehydrogenase
LFVEVEAGVVIERLERMLNGHGMTLGHVHPRAVMRTAGAAIARNLLVRRGIAFGDLKDISFAVRGLLANGTPVETRPVPRSATGPELDRAFIGAQGRLGIITKATLRIAAMPPYRDALAFEMPAIEEAIECARLSLHRGVRPAAARVMSAGEGAIVAFELAHHHEEVMKGATAIVTSAAAQCRGARIDAETHATGGRFDAVVEVATAWSKALEALVAMRAAAEGEAWLDFLAPEGVSIVARVLDASTRRAAAEAGMAAGGRLIAGLRDSDEDEAHDQPYADLLLALAANLDPTGVFRER